MATIDSSSSSNFILKSFARLARPIGFHGSSTL